LTTSIHQDHAQRFRQHGWCAVDGFFDAREVAALAGEVERFQREKLMRNVRTERDGITRSDQDRAGMAFHFLHGEVAPDGLVAPDRDRRPWVTGPRSTGGKAEYGVDVRGTFAAEVGRALASTP
jgi:hypothetical protein